MASGITTIETPIESRIVSFAQNNFDQLVQKLSDVLGPSSGLDSNDVDPQEIVDLMKEYTSTPSDWEKFALADWSRSYTRNLVDKGNGKSNLLVLVWSPSRGSPIHDHSNAHCVMKVLYGELKETLYDWPAPSELPAGETTPPRMRRETVYGENEVTYMSDELGIHRIANPHPERFAVSLHLYTPPHAATHGCHIFDEKTGKSSIVKQVAFSEYGRRL